MEAPSSTYAEAIRDEQAKVLRTIRPMSAAKITRGQFRGYRNEPGVDPRVARGHLRARCGSTWTPGAGRACRSTCVRASV